MAAGATTGGAVTEAKAARVLIVDDDVAMSRMISLWLKVDGFETVTASNGQVALDQVQQGVPDVIVLDLQMPVMDGRTFFRELRSRGYQTPVILLSAYGVKDAQAELRAEAALSKPFLPEQLVSTIGSVIGSAA